MGGDKYPVAPGTACSSDIDESVRCTNRNGDPFVCGKGSICCGDICVAPGGTCCTNSAGYKYAVTAETMCPDEMPESVQCTNRHGAKFLCGPGSSCCGDICVGESGACCTNRYGNNFACGKGSSCCGDVCAAPGSKCCVNRFGTHHPVTQATKCLPR